MRIAGLRNKTQSARVPIVISIAALFLVACLAQAGCGYRFSDSSQGLLKGVRTLDIEFSLNRSRQPGLEGPVNQALKRRFLMDGTIQPASAAAADATLRSSVIAYRETPLAYRSGEVIRQYKAEVELEVELISKGEVLFRQRFVRHRLFSSTGGILLELDINRKKAVDLVAADLADAAYVQLREAF
jgi:hypothetical protein